MFGFLKTLLGSKQAPPAPSKPVTLARRPAAVRNVIASAPLLENYADIGSVRRSLIQAGDSKGGDAPQGGDAYYTIPSELSDFLMVIERASATNVTDHGVWILVRGDGDQAVVSKLLIELRQLTGAIRSKSVEPKLFRTSKEVLSETSRALALINSQVASATRSGTQAMDLFDRWVEKGAELGTSDIHILMYGNEASVKMRVDNELVPLNLPGFKGGVYNRLSAVAAVGAAYNYALTSGSGGSQYSEAAYSDTMLTREINGRRILCRYQNNPAAPGSAQFGAKVVVRLLYLDDSNISTMADGGYALSQLKMLREASRSGSGMIIVAGVTGSGKSTLLKLFVESMPRLPKMAVSTIEDPIEYLIAPGVVHQMQVTRDIASPQITRERYGMAVKSLLRSDPDAVVVGEVRDELTARTALVLAETGHLAMFSIHAHLISNITGRLTNKEIGLSRDELMAPQILNTLVYQALVPKLCSHCAEDTESALASSQKTLTIQGATQAEMSSYRDEHDNLIEVVATLRSRFKIDTTPLRWRNMSGCTHCSGSGLKGRTVVAEVWQPDRKWLDLTREHRDYDALLHYRSYSDGDFNSADMTGKTVFEHCIWKALQGIVDIREARTFESFGRYEFAPRRSPAVIDFATSKGLAQ